MVYTVILEEEPKRYPFSDEIMEAQLPPNWKELNIVRHDETTDMDEHVDVYKTQMSLYIFDNSL